MTIKTADWTASSKPEPSFGWSHGPSSLSDPATFNTSSANAPSYSLSSSAATPSYAVSTTALSHSSPTASVAAVPSYSTNPPETTPQFPATEQSMHTNTAVKVSGCKVKWNQRLVAVISTIFLAGAVAFGLLKELPTGMRFGEDSCPIQDQIKLSNDMVNPKVAIDGSSMVLVARDLSETDSPVYIAFYSKTNDEWEIDQYVWREYSYDYTVALSGDTAMFGFQNATEAAIYQYSEGSWAEREDTLKPDLAHPREVFDLPHVDVDGDLSCFCVGSCIVFRREANIWSSTASFQTEGSHCTVNQDTISIYSNKEGLMLYRFDRDANDVVPVQDYYIPAYYGYALDTKTLVYTNSDGSISILHRDHDNEPYGFFQKLTGLEHTGSLAIENHILVIGEYDQTTIYYQNEGAWEEASELNELHFHHQLSDGTLLAVQENVIESYNLDQCVPMSEEHAMLPTAPPSPPTEDCHHVELNIGYNRCFSSVYWELTRNESGLNNIIAAYNETKTNTTHFVEHLCLLDGDYEFKIHVLVRRKLQIDPNSTCSDWYDYGVHYYAISEVHGSLLVEGGVVQTDETRFFSLP